MQTQISEPAAYRLNRRQKQYLVVKRVADLLISALALLLLALPFALIALGQKLDVADEPVLFRQTRVGRNGALFSMTKFRSLRRSANPHLPSAETQDAMSAWGRFLRRSSLDELPQLWQVFVGKMSLIGPRPLIPEEEELHRRRQATGVYQLCPGMSGWAQVNGRDLLSAEEKLRYDSEYLQNFTLGLDIKIFFRTLGCVLRRENIL